MLPPGIRLLAGNVEGICALRDNPFEAQLADLLSESFQRHVELQIEPQWIAKAGRKLFQFPATLVKRFTPVWSAPWL